MSSPRGAAAGTGELTLRRGRYRNRALQWLDPPPALGSRCRADDKSIMDDAESGRVDGEPTIVDTWLEPLEGDACGEDLEYDNDFLELTQAAAGRPETQFAPAEPPDWRAVEAKAQSLFERTRDLRVAAQWARARMANEGWSSLPDSLRLIHGLLERYWDELHPRPDPDDGDAYARINTLDALGGADGLLGDMRGAAILRSRAFGELRGRDVEIALEHLAPRDDESPPTRGQIEQMLGDAAHEDAALAQLAPRSIERLESITELMRERVGYERAPVFDDLRAALRDLQALMPEGGAAGDGAEAAVGSEDEAGPEDTAAPRRGGGLGDSVDTREDALRAIDMVCEYLERTEPTNPAQLLLRRARRLVNKNFLELMRELAPEALPEVARLMGVSPDAVGADE